jgi:hypothetical protein
MSMQARREALASRLKTTADAHGGAFHVSQRLRLATTGRTTSKERKDTMGDPVRYIEVLEDVTTPTEVRDGYDAGHAFSITVFVEYDDAERFAQSSEPDFNALMHNEGTPIGILPDLTTTDRLRDSSGAPLGRLSVTSDATPDIIGLDPTAGLYAHIHQFTVTID